MLGGELEGSKGPVGPRESSARGATRMMDRALGDVFGSVNPGARGKGRETGGTVRGRPC